MISILGLMPGQSHVALGLEVAVVSAILAVSIAQLARAGRSPESEPAPWMVARVALSTMPQVIGGVSLVAEAGGGLYWIAAGIIFAIAGAVANAWVLLVEILR